MIKLAGWLITLCGIGHSVGALVQSAPKFADEWFGWALWDEQNQNLVEMNEVTASFWFTWYSFGLPLLLFGMAVLWMARFDVAPPPFIAWGLALWAGVGAILSGPSPLLFLLPAAALLLFGDRRAKRAAARKGEGSEALADAFVSRRAGV